MQPIPIPAPRTFQQPKSEPLGPDMGGKERATIIAARSASTAAIKRVQSNAEPIVAKLRQDLSYVSHAALTLPREQLAEVADQAAALLQTVEGMLQEAQLPQTEQSAGKKERRVALRSKDSKQEKTRQPWHRKVRGLLLGRTSKRKRDDEAAQHPKWFPQYLNSQKEKKVWGRGVLWQWANGQRWSCSNAANCSHAVCMLPQRGGSLRCHSHNPSSNPCRCVASPSLATSTAPRSAGARVRRCHIIASRSR